VVIVERALTSPMPKKRVMSNARSYQWPLVVGQLAPTRSRFTQLVSQILEALLAIA
jgi:hypothetical protein